ncbi:MAG: hypothetical protein GXO88_13140 [Chlorobi bacterium]|nr:hypothetical protein [Chlorobiota bacterium]
MHKRVLYFVFAILIGLGFSCRKKDIISTDSSLKLEFSNDSIIFDTVFTSLGSATHRLMVYNKSNSKIKISDIQLEGGSSSAFRVNLDGESGSGFTDIEIEGNDSLFLFAKVTINPKDASSPFVVEDMLRFLTNGNEQEVKLVAWGQDANYILADTYNTGFPPYKIVADSLETVHWTAEKPYIVYGYAVINSYGKLIIDEGTKVYFHEASGLWAYADGLLKVYGSPDKKVYFRGDRLEQEYADIPGQWDRIWLMEAMPGEDHEIQNAVIENAFIGIQAESFLRAADNQLLLHNVIIRNMSGIGLFSRLYNITSTNTLLANCGGYCLALTSGGDYDFKHATLVNFWNYSVRNTPSLFLNNYILDTLDNVIAIPFNFNIGNSIIYGYNNEEFQTDMSGDADSSYFLDHCLLKTRMNTSDNTIYNAIIRNEDPLFVNASEHDFHLDTLSPAIGMGDPNIANGLQFDLDGISRLPLPDLGVYQFVPGIEK